MDADDDESARKRKAAGADSLRKKLRRSTRGRSEFVSVEVGLREFKKRLADADATGETHADREAGTAEKTTRKTPVKRKTPVRRTTRATAKRQLTLEGVKLQLEQEQKQRVEARIQTLHRKAHLKEAVGAATVAPVAAAVAVAAKSLASTPVPVAAASVAVGRCQSDGDVVLKIEAATASGSVQEQERRVESNCEATAALSSLQPAAVDDLAVNTQAPAEKVLPPTQAPVSVLPSESAPSEATNEFIADDAVEDWMFAMALEDVERKLATPQKSSRIDDMTSSEPSSLAPVSCQPSFASLPPANASFVVSPVQKQTNVSRSLIETTRGVSPPKVLTTPAVLAVPAVPTALAPPPMLLAHAVSVPVVSVSATEASASVVSDPVVSAPTLSDPAVLTAVAPARAPEILIPAASTPVVTASAVSPSATSAAAVTPEVLEEMERLKQENELLRRSNELLQAAVTYPAQSSAPAKGKNTSRPRKQRTTRKKDNCGITPSKDAPSVTSTPRYLDLGRHDSDVDMEQEDFAAKGNQNQEQSLSPDVESGVYATGNSGQENHAHTSDDIDPHENHDMTCIEDERPLESLEPGVPGSRIADQTQDIATTESFSRDMPTADDAVYHAAPMQIDTIHEAKVTSVQTEPLLRAASTAAGEEDTTTPMQVESEHTREVAIESASSRSASDTHISSAKEINIALQGANDSDDGDVSDYNMSDEDKKENNDNDEEEFSQRDDNPLPRTSTIDSGTYVEYKVHHEEDNVEVFENEHSARDVDSKTESSEEKIQTTASKSTTPASSEILERTAAPSNTDDEEDEDEDEDEDEVMVIKRKGRLGVVASSSSESESESESEEDDISESDDTPSANVLEAALRAAGGDSTRKGHRAKASGASSNMTKTDEVSNKGKNNKLSSAGSIPGTTSFNSPPSKSTSKKRKTPPSVSTKKPAVKSSLLWPTLDEFYDFLLSMSPRNVREAETKRIYLQRYSGRKLPTRHSSIDEYCGVQLEAITEELVASVSNSTDRRGGGSSGPTRHLSLTSVSPCGAQGPSSSTPSLGLSFGAIFSESGFSGKTSNSDDYILAFDASVLGKIASDFLSGDLVLVRSPRWKNYDMSVFGVVLCNSLVAVGGRSGLSSKNNNGGSGENDQICVLIRASRGHDDVSENFSILTELCLANQRSPNWRWAIQQVHNTTTSAREFQAIKSISFFSNDLKQMLLRGQLLPSAPPSTGKKEKADPGASILSPKLLKYLHKHYNESQVQAILGCLGGESRVIIQGPPGTGKTKTILGLLSALLDGAGLSTLQKAKGTARIRVGASLQSAKTTTVSKTVAETSIRILVAAPSNAAVDELVVRLLSEGLFDGEKGEIFRPRIVRVGKPESGQQVSSLAAAREASGSKKNRKKMRKYAREVEEVLLDTLVTKHRKTFPTVKQTRQAIIKNAQIVFCTLSGAGSVAMCDFAHDFDALIIDEAAQAVEASTLIPFKFRPHRVVLVGDHRQLPATVISKKLVSMGYDRSLLQRLIENDSPVLLLTKQYRMHPEIAEFPSAYFYGGRLVQDAKMSEWTAQEYHRDSAFKPLLFLDVQGGAQSQVSGSTSLRNLSEVEVVVQLVRRLVKTFPKIEWKKRVGVIAPYKQQIYEVRAALARLESECDRQLGIEVNTVDGFQGREKEIIIYSCVRTSHGGRRRKKKRKQHDNSGDDDVLDAFWADERRMNVAITRAKSSLWIVGNSTLLEQSRAWRALIQHTKDHDRYIGDATAAVLPAASSSRSTPKSK